MVVLKPFGQRLVVAYVELDARLGLLALDALDAELASVGAEVRGGLAVCPVLLVCFQEFLAALPFEELVLLVDLALHGFEGEELVYLRGLHRNLLTITFWYVHWLVEHPPERLVG